MQRAKTAEERPDPVNWRSRSRTICHLAVSSLGITFYPVGKLFKTEGEHSKQLRKFRKLTRLTRHPLLKVNNKDGWGCSQTSKKAPR